MEKVKAKLVKFKRWLVASITIIIILLASFFAIPVLFPPTPPTGALTPVIVDAGAITAATYQQPQGKTFNDSTNLWVFYTNGSHIIARYSTDGLTWSSLINVQSFNATVAEGHWFSIRYYTYSGTKYVYLAWVGNYTSGEDLFFKRITISNTSLVLGTEYLVYSTTLGNRRLGYPNLDVDTNGKLHLGVSVGALTGLKSLVWQVYTNPNNDGSSTWTYISAADINSGNSLGDINYTHGAIVRLTNGFMYEVATQGEAAMTWVKGKNYNGTAGTWNSTLETVITNFIQYNQFGVTAAYNDAVMIAYAYSNHAYFKWRNNTSTVWSAQESLSSVLNYLTQDGVSLTVSSSSGDAWFFWVTSNSTAYIVYQKRFFGKQYMQSN